MYEQSQRDLRNKQQELQRVNAELDKTRELKDQLARENKKLSGDCHYFIHLFTYDSRSENVTPVINCEVLQLVIMFCKLFYIQICS